MSSTFDDRSTSPRILVLLPFFNGSQYLRPQLDSILTQSFGHVDILCRDDGSSDQSLAIVEDYAHRYPSSVHLIEDQLGNLGACGSFALLIKEALQRTQANPSSAATYFALADQDDIWHPDKLKLLLETMVQLEGAEPDVPALVHGDLRVVDQDLQEIAPSMADYQGLRPERDSLSAQLISNTVTGCTTLLNRALLERSLPIPPDAIMHDWWISLVASAFGRRRYLKTPLVNYRQHANNTIGAKAWTERNRYQMKPGLAALPRNLYHVARVIAIMTVRMFDDEHNAAFQSTAKQARAFLKCFGGELNGSARLKVQMAGWMRLHFPPLQRLLFKALRQL